jgi:hypothetical protein
VAVTVTAPMLVEQHQPDQVHSQPKAAHNPKRINFDSQSIKPIPVNTHRAVVMLWILTKKDYISKQKIQKNLYFNCFVYSS